MTNVPQPTPFFDAVPADAGTERFDVLYQHRGVVIERIVSSGTQPAQLYCQPEDEWVLLLRGHAEIRIDGGSITLQEGEFLHLAANTPHVVVSTSQNALWLAIHVQDRVAQ